MKPITAKVDGRSSALRALKAHEDTLLSEAAAAYTARSPDYAEGMVRGYQMAKEALYASRGAWAAFRALIKDAA